MAVSSPSTDELKQPTLGAEGTMSERWLDSATDDQAAARTEKFWAVMRADLDAGEFWAERIKRYRDEPGRRLQTAMDNLPLPSAFREAAVALRTIIRAKRKVKEPYTEELGLLYWLAAIRSFMLPYADKLKQPGFNVVQSIPGTRLRAMPVDYAQVGYEQLDLLNKTDVKWLVQVWGEPQQHQTLNQVHRALWDEYESKLVDAQQAENEKFIRELRDLGKPIRKKHPRPDSSVGSLFMVLLLLALTAFIVLTVVKLMERFR
jgi:hypothetical protein